MKYYMFFVGFYTTTTAATYLHNTDWILQARHISPYLDRRGIIRAQHAATKPSQKEKPSMQKSVRFAEPIESTPTEQIPRPKSPQSPKKSSPQPPSNHPRISLEAEGPAAMTMARGNLPADFLHHSDTSTRRLSGEHAEKVIGMVRAPDNPTNTNSQTLRGNAYGQGVSARVMIPQGGSGSIRTETDRGVRTVDVPSGGMASLTASSDRPRGAKAIAKSTPPGLVSLHAGNERNFGDP